MKGIVRWNFKSWPMKPIVLANLLLFALGLQLHAQPTITSREVARAGEQFIRSRSLSLPNGVEWRQPGPNQTWDFRMLRPNQQDTLLWTSPASINGIYGLFFADIFFNPNRANLAQRLDGLSFIPNLPIEDLAGLYFVDAQSYQQKGWGITVGGIPLPVAFSTPDFIYRFPLRYAQRDSSESGWRVQLPNLGAIVSTTKRVNHVDGWGLLRTPLGDFNVLRVRSVITGRDSIYLDTLRAGVNIPRRVVEYKWWSPQQKIPVLQITTLEVLGVETIVGIEYPDVLRPAANDDQFVVAEDMETALAIATNDRRIAGAQWRIITPPQQGSLIWPNRNDPPIYRPNPNYWGLDRFTYAWCFGEVCDTAQVDLLITPVNDAPIVKPLDTTLAQITALTLDLGSRSQDPDNDLLTFEYGAISGPATLQTVGLGQFSSRIVITPTSMAQRGSRVALPVKVCDLTIVPPVRQCDSTLVVVRYPVLTSSNNQQLSVKTPTLSPNPVADVFTLDRQGWSMGASLRYRIINANGQILHEGILPPAPSHQLSFPATGAPGWYGLELWTPQARLTLPFLHIK